MELRVPPVVIVATASLGMWLAARALPAGPPGSAGARAVFAATLAVVGVSLAVAGIREFRVARTTVNPLQPGQASSMVTSGVYRYTRNPMYLGMLCLLAGWGAWLGRWAPFCVLPVFVLYMNRFQIAAEERALEQRFGAAFREYAGRVRRWL
jgi:protein-S-isoprenylcysteine O-methyltransferase Ste14